MEQLDGVATPYLKMLGPVSNLLGVSLHWLVLGEGPEAAASLHMVDVAARHGASPAAIADAIESMSADELERIVERKRAEEMKAWNAPIHEAIAALEAALAENPPLSVRDEITRTLDRMRARLAEETAAETTPTDDLIVVPGQQGHAHRRGRGAVRGQGQTTTEAGRGTKERSVIGKVIGEVFVCGWSAARPGALLGIMDGAASQTAAGRGMLL